MDCYETKKQTLGQAINLKSKEDEIPSFPLFMWRIVKEVTPHLVISFWIIWLLTTMFGK